MNDSLRFAESVPAALEIGPERDIFTHDKVADLINPPARGGGLESGGQGGSIGGGFLSVALGSITGQITDNIGSSEWRNQHRGIEPQRGEEHREDHLACALCVLVFTFKVAC